MAKKELINEKFPFVWHGGDYCPEQWQYAPEILNEDMRLFDKVGINALTVNMFAWSTIEPEEGKYDFSYLDDVFERAEKHGKLIILGTPSGARPAYMAKKYPEILRTNELGQKNLFGNRHNHCFTSPKYRELTAKIDGELAKRYKNSKSLAMWHISNEFNGECHCELCKKAFREWLKMRYDNNIDKLNFAYWNTFWSHTYSSWDEIDPPSSLGEMRNWAHLVNWKRFITYQTAEFMRIEIRAVKEFTPDIPVTTNFMGANLGLNYRELAREVDVISDDNYPNWHHYFGCEYIANQLSFTANLQRSLKHKPYMIMENAPSATNWTDVNKLKRPNVNRLSALSYIAHGADTVLYFQLRAGRGGSEMYHGAVIDHTGTDKTRVFGEVAALSGDLKKLDCIAGTETRAETALFFDWENTWAASLTKGFNNTNDKNFIKTVYKHHMPFWKNGIATDIIGYDDDFSKYKLIVAPMMYMTPQKFIDKIEDYVKNGGTFVTTYYSGMADENNMAYLGGFPANKLMNVFGVWAEEIDALYPEDDNFAVYNGKNYKICDMCAVVHQKGGRAIAKYGNDFYKDMPAVIENSYGNGKAYYVAFRSDGSFEKDFYPELIKKCGIKSEFDGNLPYGVSANARYDGNTAYVFVQNFSDKSVVIKTDEKYDDILNRTTVTGEFTLNPYDVRVMKKTLNQ